MKLILAVKETREKGGFWEIENELGYYSPETRTVFYPRPEAFTSRFHCSLKTAKVLCLISVLHETGHYFHKHEEKGYVCNDQEVDAWLYCFQCIKPNLWSIIWMAYDLIYSDEMVERIRKKAEHIRDLISIRLSTISQISSD